MMRREDFQTDDIPDDYQVYDVDLTPSGRPMAVLGHASDERAPAYALLDDTMSNLPDNSLFRRVSAPLVVFPLIRCLGEDRAVVVRGRVRRDEEINAWILNRSGEIEDGFHAGDNIEEVLANEDWIVFHYGDEGMTGDVDLSFEGLTVFDSAGNFVWGHRSQFGDVRLGVFFHAAGWISSDDVAVFRDVDQGSESPCSFVSLNVRDCTESVSQPPDEISRPTAVTAIGGDVLSYGHWNGVKQDQIVRWRPGSDEWTAVGSFPSGVSVKHPPLRGLPGGRFIAPKPDGYTVLSFE